MKKKELKKINESQILIVGLARNCANTIEKEIYNIDKSPSVSNNTNKDEALSALEVLGFAKKQSERIVVKILSDSPDASVEFLIKEALKNL